MTEDDFSHQVGASHRRGAMIMADWDYLLDAPDNSCLYCLTDQQVRALLVVAEYLGWPTRYYSDLGTTISRDDVDALRAGVVNALMTDKCTEILTKIQEVKDKVDHIETMITTLETDLDLSQTAQDVALAGILSELTGLVEPSLVGIAAAIAGVSLQVTGVKGVVDENSTDVDNIETILTDATHGLVEVSQDVDSIELLVTKMKASVTNVFNNSTTINVENYLTFGTALTDNTTTELYARYNALCAAAQEWVLLEGYAVLDALGAPSADLGTIELLIAVAYFNIAATLSVAGSYTYDATTVYAALVDSSAVNDVACAMIQQLAGLTVTQVNFTQALNAYTPPAYPDHRYILKVTLSNALTYLDGYTAMVSLLQSEYVAQLALAPTGYSCSPCDPVYGAGTYNFVLGQKAPWLIVNGKMTLGLGIESTNFWATGSGANHALASIYILLNGTSFYHNITFVVHDTNDNEGRGVSGSNHQFFMAYTWLVSGVPTRVESSPQTATVNADTTMSFGFPGGGTGSQILKIEFYSKLDVTHHWILSAVLS